MIRPVTAILEASADRGGAALALRCPDKPIADCWLDPAGYSPRALAQETTRLAKNEPDERRKLPKHEQ